MSGLKGVLVTVATLVTLLTPVAAPLAAAPAGGRDAPAVALREREIVISALPAILGRPEVRPHLSTGLTTTLLFEVRVADGKGGEAHGGAMVDVRYEPWDEVFLVSVMGVDGRSRDESLPSFERLVAWWQGLQVAAISPAGVGSLGAGAPWRVEVRLSVLPFSQAEQRAAQRWLADSIGSREQHDLTLPAGRTEPLAGALDALLATSIQRQRLVTYDWTVLLPAESRR